MSDDIKKTLFFGGLVVVGVATAAALLGMSLDVDYIVLDASKWRCTRPVYHVVVRDSQGREVPVRVHNVCTQWEAAF